MGDAVKIVKKNGCAVAVYYDTCAESPREWDNLGKLFLRTRSIHVTECEEEDVKRAAVRLPVYKYEHSGISLGTDNTKYPFNDPWDSCLAGYIIALPEDIRKEYNIRRITKKVREKVAEILKSEVATYNQYIEGEVYGYKVFSGVPEDTPDNEVEEVGTEEDSCWGYYGIEDALNDGMLMVPEPAMA